MTFVPVLLALTVIVVASLFIIVSIQRAFTRTAKLRSDLRTGGPFISINYAVSEPAWPVAAPLPGLRKPAERQARAAAARARKVSRETEAA